MSLKRTNDLIFFEQYGDINSHFGTIGLFRSKFLVKFQVWKTRNLICRALLPKPKTPTDLSEDVTFVGMVYFEKRAKAQPFLMKNVVALDGYGPTMYAAFMQLAKDEGYVGVLPTQIPEKILAKPKKIWKRFSGSEYKARITLTKWKQTNHNEPWLNNIYSVAANPIIDLNGMRERYTEFSDACQHKDLTSSLYEIAMKLGDKSVEAHAKTQTL